MVTRAREQAGGLADLLTQRGADVLTVPTIAIAPPESWSEVDDSIRELARGAFDWVAFTSANGVDRFFSRLGCAPEEVFRDAKVAAVGSATERMLVDRGVEPDLVPETFTAEALADALGDGTGAILLPRAASVPPTMVVVLKARGWEPREVEVYRTTSVAPEGSGAAEVSAGRFDVVTFTSASTVVGFADAFEVAALGLTETEPSERLVACIGPVTARACASRGLRVDLIAGPHTAEGMVSAIEAACGT